MEIVWSVRHYFATIRKCVLIIDLNLTMLDSYCNLQFEFDYSKIYASFTSVENMCVSLSFCHFILTADDIKHHRHSRMVISKVYDEPFFQTYELLSRATNKIVILSVHFLHYDFAARFTTRRRPSWIYVRLRLYILVYICILMCTHTHICEAHKMIRSKQMVVDILHLNIVWMCEKLTRKLYVIIRKRTSFIEF